MISWISSQVFYFSNPSRECVFWPKCLRETSNHWTFKEKAEGQGSRVMCQTRKRQDIKKSSFVEKGTFIYGKILGGLYAQILFHRIRTPNSHSFLSHLVLITYITWVFLGTRRHLIGWQPMTWCVSDVTVMSPNNHYKSLNLFLLVFWLKRSLGKFKLINVFAKFTFFCQLFNLHWLIWVKLFYSWLRDYR